MKLKTWLPELLFPTRCVICREFLDGGRPRICPDCMEKISFTEDGGKRHGDFFSLCVSAVYYEKAFRQSFLRYKFGGAQAYAAAYGELLGSVIYEQLDGKYDLISWVPLDRRRARKRGYDQTKKIAFEAAKKLDMQPVALLKKRPGITAQSATGSPERRRANIAGAYTVIDRELVAGKRILMIDDIVTTGATLSECAKTLLMAGAEDVCCATLARTRE